MFDLNACCFKHVAWLPGLGIFGPLPSCLLQDDKEGQIKFTIKTDVYQPESQPSSEAQGIKGIKINKGGHFTQTLPAAVRIFMINYCFISVIHLEAYFASP